MRIKNNLLKMVFLVLPFLMVACVKDIDIDQTEEVVLSPEAAVDLVFFTIFAEDFSSSSGALKATDVTRLDFLDDDYIQDNLVKANFNYRFTNSFQEELKANIRFLSENNRVQHNTIVRIPAGSEDAPAIIDFVDLVNEDQIQTIRKSIKMSVEITMQEGSNMNGELQMESKAFLYFEF